MILDFILRLPSRCLLRSLFMLSMGELAIRTLSTRVAYLSFPSLCMPVTGFPVFSPCVLSMVVVSHKS